MASMASEWSRPLLQSPQVLAFVCGAMLRFRTTLSRRLEGHPTPWRKNRALESIALIYRSEQQGFLRSGRTSLERIFLIVLEASVDFPWTPGVNLRISCAKCSYSDATYEWKDGIWAGIQLKQRIFPIDWVGSKVFGFRGRLMDLFSHQTK